MDMRKAFVRRSFTDAGTRRAFVAGEVDSVTEGEFLNFKAAGLVAAVKPSASKTKTTASVAASVADA